MKYSLCINQKMALELGIENLNQAIIFDLLSICSVWAQPVMIDDKVYYWVARQVVVRELPLMNIKPKTVYRHLKSLDKLGLIEYIKHGKKDCICLTELGKKYYTSTMWNLDSRNTLNRNLDSAKQESKLQKNGNLDSTYHTTSINPTTKLIKATTSTIKKFVKPTTEQINNYQMKTKNKIIIDADGFIDYYESNGWMVGKNKMKKWKYAVNTWIRNELNNKNFNNENKTNEKFNKPQSNAERIEQTIKELLEY